MSRPKDQQLLTDKEVAFYTGLSFHSLQSSRSNKSNLQMPPYVRIGRKVRYDVDDLIDWICSRCN